MKKKGCPTRVVPMGSRIWDLIDELKFKGNPLMWIMLDEIPTAAPARSRGRMASGRPLALANSVLTSSIGLTPFLSKNILIREEPNGAHSAFLRRAMAALTVASSSAARSASISSRCS